jgi:hypothetical protein
MCLYPNLIKNRRYIANKKNGGEVPPCDDERKLWVPVGCGKCIECRKMKSREWQVRLHEEIRERKNGKFVTLTYSEEELNKLDEEIDKELTGYNRDNAIATLSVRRFTERWRKHNKKTIRHWLVTELGGTRTERLHIHGIVWTDKINEVEEVWKYGKMWVGEYVNAKTINYIIKYVTKIDDKHKEYKSKIYSSKGIGKGYIKRKDALRNKYIEEETNETYTTKNGMKLKLPIYYRNKIYSEEEKEKLWVEKLNKNERWVMGIKINIEENEEEYYKVLNEKRKLNKRLGYGDDSINWEQKVYERNRRNLKRMERIKKANR